MTPDPDVAPILIDRPAPHVARLLLNRPDKRNAIDQGQRDALREAAAAVFSDPEARAVVFGGAGTAFSAGGDLPSMKGLSHAQAQARMEQGHAICRLFVEADVPVITAMQGASAGASVGLALLGDHVVVGPSTRILFPFIKLGLTPDWGLMRSLPQRVGLARARRLILSGGSVDGPTAVQIGLADELADDEAIMRTAIERAAEYAQLPRLATARIKARLREFDRLDFGQDLKSEATNQVDCLTHPEFAEGLAAQMERRAPDFVAVGETEPTS